MVASGAAVSMVEDLGEGVRESQFQEVLEEAFLCSRVQAVATCSSILHCALRSCSNWSPSPLPLQSVQPS